MLDLTDAELMEELAKRAIVYCPVCALALERADRLIEARATHPSARHIPILTLVPSRPDE